MGMTSNFCQIMEPQKILLVGLATLCLVTICRCQFNPECKLTTMGKEYRGTVSTTKTGKACQRWDDLMYRNINISKYPSSGLEENFCRNPNDSPGGPWCYLADNYWNDRWEYCPVKACNPEMEIGLIAGKPGASSVLNSYCTPDYAFLLQVKGRNYRMFYSKRNSLPVTIWYKFAKEMSIIPRRIKFQAGGGHFPAAKWQFIGTTSANCNQDANWVTLCEDLSGTPRKEKWWDAVAECSVDKNITKSFTCLGIRALEAPPGDDDGLVGFSNIQMWGIEIYTLS